MAGRAAVTPAIWLVNPLQGDSWALTGDYDDLRWMALTQHLIKSGIAAMSVGQGDVAKLPEPRAVVLNGLIRTAPQAIRVIRTIRQRFPTTPIYVTGRAGQEVSAAVRASDVIHTSEDQLAESLGPDGRLRAMEPSMRWWSNTTPSRPQGPQLPLGVLEMEATRGCTHHCTFCSVFVSNGGTQRIWQPRPPSEVAAEIAHWHAEAGITRVQFIDDNFLGSPTAAPGWADQLASELLWRVPAISHSIYSRLDHTLLKSLPSLRAAGLVQVHAGVESASNDVLRRLAKGLTIEEIDHTWSALSSLGVEVVPSFIVFEPRSSPAEVITTLDWIERNDLAVWFTPSTALPLVGTTLAKQLLGGSPSSFLNEDGTPSRHAVPFTNPVVAEAHRVGVALDDDALQRQSPDLETLMRHRFGRDGNLLCEPIHSDALLRALADYRTNQIAVVRRVLETGR